MSFPGLILKLAAKLRVPFLRKFLLKGLFRRRGLRLQDFLSYHNDRHFLYRIGKRYLPSESFTDQISYESQLKKCREESLYFYSPKPGDTILDIGAGLGEEVLFYAEMAGPGGRVLAVEANPLVYEVLLKTVELNKLTNVTCFNTAIYSSSGETGLDTRNPSYEAAHIEPVNTNGVMKVRATRLGDFIAEQGLTRIDFMKVNIEGSEQYVVNTLSAEDFSRIKHLAIACHDFRYREENNPFFRTKEFVISSLKKNKFDLLTRQTPLDYLNDWVYGTNQTEQP